MKATYRIDEGIVHYYCGSCGSHLVTHSKSSCGLLPDICMNCHQPVEEPDSEPLPHYKAIGLEPLFRSLEELENAEKLYSAKLKDTQDQKKIVVDQILTITRQEWRKQRG